MAHIVADSESGPRGNSPLKSEQRDRYENLILLCPNHHTLIDRDEDAFPVELLHAYKSEHEAWVRDRMGLPDGTDEAALHLYGRLIDMASELFTRWSELTERAMYTSPYWLKADVERTRRFREAVLRAPFSQRNRELEAAIIRLSMALAAAVDHFLVHAEEDDRYPDRWAEIRFYKIERYDEDLYFKLAREYDAWIQREDALMIESSKTANWLCDVVRRDLNPYFFLNEGRLLATHGDDLSSRQVLYLYDQDERDRAIADPFHSLDRAQSILEKFIVETSERSTQ